MPKPTHSARITGPVPYVANGGEELAIPLGPCLVEQLDDRLVDIIWGAMGENSIALPRETIESARARGDLVLID